MIKQLCHKWHFALCLVLAAVTSPPAALALTEPSGYSIAVGVGEPDDLRGIRIAAQWDWQRRWFSDNYFDIRGYWDASLAAYSSDGNVDEENRALGVVAFAPMFRLQGTDRLSRTYSPYFQASVGLSLLTRNHLGRRDLGKNWQFQDFLGGGVQFGEQMQWDVGLTYLHYSNAGFNPPNQGIDVKVMLMLQYHLNPYQHDNAYYHIDAVDHYPYPK